MPRQLVPHHLTKAMPLVALVALTACQKPDAAQPAPTQTTTGTVVREQTDPTPTPTPAPVQQATIQTQAGPSGTQVALNKVAVTGDILTVQLTYTGGTESAWQTPAIDQVAVIVDASSQKIGVLKDGEGNFMASPINSGVRTVMGFHTGQGPQIVWFKFPAPPATAKTVSINVPDVVPFDGVPVTR